MGAHKYNVAAKAERIADGIVFASKKEMGRYLELKLLERAGEITNLELQPTFVLQPTFTDANGKRWQPIKYTADFSYYEKGSEPGTHLPWIIEDVKGMETQVFRLKLKLFKFVHERRNSPTVELRIVK